MAHYDIGDALSLIENILLASMRRNLNRHLHEEADEGFQWSMWQAEQLTSLGNWSARNLKTHSKDFTLINNAAMQLLQNANNQAELDEELKLLRSGIQQAAEFFDVPDEKFQALLNAVRSDLSMAEHSILRQADDMYRKAIFDANVYLQTGSGTLKDAIGMAVQDMHTRGIRAVMYRNGRRVTASAYARMALRTANERAQLMGEGRARDKFGVHTIIVPPSGIACPQCAPFLGKIMVDDVYCAGTPEEAKGLGVPLLSEAIGQGFLHPQCNCSPQTYFPGSPASEMTEQNREEAVRKYKLTQRQRYNERQIRKWKAAERSAPNDLEKQAARGKIRAWQKQNRELCDKYPDTLRRDYEREKLYDLTSKAIVPDVIEKPANVLDKSAESGIIELRDGEEMLRKAKTGKVEPMPKKQFQRIVKRFKAQGGLIQFDDETDAYLMSKNAEAITYNANTILIRQNPGRASVYEELIHTTQYRNGENDGSYPSRLRCEIAAQEKLLKYAKVYKLTDSEIIQTQKALEAYQRELSEYLKNGGV